ncbi:MAG: hypothetical protein HQ492_03070 [Woeseiaceae bacterium]|nr:hypothetical protein [Woeseiaceae bacterium]
MNITKAAVPIALAGLVISASAIAMPGFSEQAPMSSVEQCVAEIGKQANYDRAARVINEVDSKERRVGGYTIMIDTKVFAAEGSEILREYATVCAVSDQSETKVFKIKEKSI